MPHIDNQVIVNASVGDVYAIAKRVEDFPNYISDVESITVLERSADGTRTVTDWVGVVKDFKIKIHWVEEDIWDDDNMACAFRQIKGDYQQYNGSWNFSQTAEGGTTFASHIEYDIEIPLIGPLLKALVAKLMKSNAQRILDAIKAEAERKQLTVS